MKLRGLASLVILSCLGCSGSEEAAVTTPPAEKRSAAQADRGEPIGDATMQDDGTIIMNLVAAGPNGEVGHAQFRYPPTDPEYKSVSKHVGPLEPGQSVLVYPWPESP